MLLLMYDPSVPKVPTGPYIIDYPALLDPEKYSISLISPYGNVPILEKLLAIRVASTYHLR